MGGMPGFLADHVTWIIGEYLVASVAGFICMGLDKSRARKNAWRIPERTLLSLAVLGGATGILLGMRVFRHKTKHARFIWSVPFLLIVQAGLLLWLLIFNN